MTAISASPAPGSPGPATAPGPGSAASQPSSVSLAFREFQGLMTNYRRTWRGSVISSVLNPLLFLTAMGVSLAKLVDKGPGASSFGHSQGSQVTYLLFLAPALLAATAMQSAIGEATYPVMSSMKWQRTYHAAIASPLRPRDIFFGHLSFMMMRVAMNCAVFFGVMALFGAVHFTGPLGLGPFLAFFGAVLTGLAFAAPLAGWSITQERDSGFAIVFRFVMMPLFLFSGTFFPVTQLPALIRPLAYVTPLWHGVDLCRGLALGTASGLSVLVHVAFLGAVCAAGLAYGCRTYRRKLNV
jgi:lipooligosaccharide transport system permease protein